MVGVWLSSSCKDLRRKKLRVWRGTQLIFQGYKETFLQAIGGSQSWRASTPNAVLFLSHFMGVAIMLPSIEERGTIWANREEHFLQDPSVTKHSLKLFGNNPGLSPSFRLLPGPRGCEGLCLPRGMPKHREVLFRAHSAPRPLLSHQDSSEGRSYGQDSRSSPGFPKPWSRTWTSFPSGELIQEIAIPVRSPLLFFSCSWETLQGHT